MGCSVLFFFQRVVPWHLAYKTRNWGSNEPYWLVGFGSTEFLLRLSGE